MRKRKPEETLDEFLAERKIPDDPELASLARAADRLERGLNVETPDAYRERALFVQGVASRKPGFPWARLMVPLAAASVAVAFVAISRSARPGDALYGFRKALDRVGIAESPDRTARELLDEARGDVTNAENLLDQEFYGEARVEASDAIVLLAEARLLLQDSGLEAREEGLERAIEIEEDALDVLVETHEEQAERAEDRNEDRSDADEDNSGPGSGDDSGGDDNSGPGGGDDSGDDNSGSGGGGDDSGGDDSSGSGSGGDDSSGDDSSGSGSGDDSDGDDSSGSGSGGDDSSGSGSGDDSSGSGGGDD